LKNRIRFRDINIRIFILPFLIITFFFISISFKFNERIKDQYYNLKEEEAKRISISYSTSISKSAEAIELLNEQMEDKILLASKATILYDDKKDNELLAQLADAFEVDEINFYNAEGIIVNSNTGENIGWKTFQGHPAYDFMKNSSTSYVEDIRQNVITGVNYKYGYFKGEDGCFIQIGVLADRINHIYNTFDIQQFLNNIKDEDIVDIFFMDTDFKIISSTNEEYIGETVKNDIIINRILSNNAYGFNNNNDYQELYEVYVPVNIPNGRIGALGIRYSLDSYADLIDGITFMGLLALMFIYATLIFVLLSTYKNNKRLVKMAYYDSLTGLPNKQYLNKYLSGEFKGYKSDKKSLLLVKLNNLRFFNLTFGYEFGDIVLIEMSRKLHSYVNQNIKLYRFTADKFILLIRKYDDEADIISLVEDISSKFDKPLEINDSEQYVSINIGIVKIKNKYSSVDELLKNASIATNNINFNDTLNYAFFNEEMEIKLQREEMIEREIRAAIADNSEKLYVEYQPLIDLRTNNIVGFEALARFKSSSFGSVSPVEFIDIAERTQLIIPLSNYILRKACMFISEVNAMGFDDLKVAVNISGVHLLREDFTSTIVNIITETGIKGSNLDLEITESILLDNYELVNEKLKTLRELQIGIALDDFGTGYSSFSRLKELNIDTLKIDKYFISKISISKEDEVITGDIISIAHKLGLVVVAEGVEHEEQKEYLIEKNGDIIQGYLFSKPIPKTDAINLLKINNK
jgi:diguanylate cyclase (GGDEF)-like protein